MDIKQQILVALGLNKAKELKLEWQSKTEDGTILVSTADELEAGTDIGVLTEDGTVIPLPIGTYKTETGLTVRVEEEGVVGELIESETEEEETPKEEVEAAKEDEDKDDYEESEAEETDWAKTYEEMKDRVDNLEDAIADIKAKIGGDDMEDEDKEEELSIDRKEPSENPSKKTTKTTETIEFSIEKLKAENAKLKEELNKKPAEAPLNTNKFSSDKVALTKKQYNKLSKKERFLYNLNK
jgi:hypothetical protein